MNHGQLIASNLLPSDAQGPVFFEAYDIASELDRVDLAASVDDSRHEGWDPGRIDRPDVDALVVPGGNFPTMDWIAAWERQFGKPVITTNQAALWAVLQTMKFDMPLPGKGRLLEQLPAG
jgi:hypothetical protein